MNLSELVLLGTVFTLTGQAIYDLETRTHPIWAALDIGWCVMLLFYILIKIHNHLEAMRGDTPEQVEG